jgi:cyclopropane fatty-acyl-phospholipid synthase-like methyltransferase
MIRLRYNWQARAAAAAALIGPSTRWVLDLGCGRRALQQYLAPETGYVGVDISPNVGADVVCRLYRRLPPLGAFDVIVALGLWEYLADEEVVPLATDIARHTERLLTSHYADHHTHGRSREDFRQLMSAAGWRLRAVGSLGHRRELLYEGSLT